MAMAGHDPIPPITDETAALKARITTLESELAHYRSTTAPPPPPPPEPTPTLTPAEYLRYSRQLILPEIGLPGQKALKAARILIVGIGGLGSPAATYLAGAGVGTLGLVDHDTVEASNLHRQTVHSTSRVGLPKVLSAIQALRDLNPNVVYTPHHTAFTSENALEIVQSYDVVLDCTDHPSLRYLISDACVLLGKPLVSASALRTEGQMMLLNTPPGRGPCYRCVWPRPPPAASVVSCGDGGVLGPVVGVMGVLQALEGIRVVVRPQEEREARMVFFSAFAGTPWRVVKMRGRRIGCCEGITREKLREGGYVDFCGVPEVERVEERFRVSVSQARERRGKALVVDVRDPTQFGVCSVPGSINIPFSRFLQAEAAARRRAGRVNGGVGGGGGGGGGGVGGGVLPEEMLPLLARAEEQGEDVLLLCRLGNDSQAAVKRVIDVAGGRVGVFDVRGGIREWARVAPEDGVVEY